MAWLLGSIVITLLCEFDPATERRRSSGPPIRSPRRAFVSQKVGTLGNFGQSHCCKLHEAHLHLRN